MDRFQSIHSAEQKPAPGWNAVIHKNRWRVMLGDEVIAQHISAGADARVMAAAHALFDACQAMVSSCRRCDGTGRAPDEDNRERAADARMDCPDCAPARLAIAKAKP